MPFIYLITGVFTLAMAIICGKGFNKHYKTSLNTAIAEKKLIIADENAMKKLKPSAFIPIVFFILYFIVSFGLNSVIGVIAVNSLLNDYDWSDDPYEVYDDDDASLDNDYVAEDKYIEIVKNGYNENYPDVTYETAFSAFFDTPRWSYFKSDDELDVVEFTGDCTYRDTSVKARIQFTVDKDNGIFEAVYLAFNEVPQDMFTMVALFTEVFEVDETRSEYVNNQPNSEMDTAPTNSNEILSSNTENNSGTSSVKDNLRIGLGEWRNSLFVDDETGDEWKYVLVFDSDYECHLQQWDPTFWESYHYEYVVSGNEISFTQTLNDGITETETYIITFTDYDMTLTPISSTNSEYFLEATYQYDQYLSELLYNDLPVSTFFDYTIDDIMEAWGEPIDEGYYNGGEYYGYEGGIAFIPDYNTGAINYIIGHPSIFEIDGVALDKNRAELIDLFGNPTEEYWGDDYEPYMIYEHSNYSIWFNMSNEDSEAYHITIRLISSEDGNDDEDSDTSNHQQNKNNSQDEGIYILDNTTPIKTASGNIYKAPADMILATLVKNINILNPNKIKYGCKIQIVTGKSIFGLYNTYEIDEDGKPGGTVYSVVDVIVID